MDTFSRSHTNDKSKDREEIQHPKPGDSAKLETHRKRNQRLMQWTQDSHKLDRALTMVVSSQYTPKELLNLVESIPTSDLTRPHPTNGPENTKPFELSKEIASAIVENFTQKMNQRMQEQAINAIDSTGGNLNKAHSIETDRTNEQRNMEKQPSPFRTDAEAFAQNPIPSKTEVQHFMMQGSGSSGSDYTTWRQRRTTEIQGYRNGYPGHQFGETVEQQVDREYREWYSSQQQASQANTSYSNLSGTQAYQARDQQQQPQQNPISSYSDNTQTQVPQQYRDSSAPTYGQSDRGYAPHRQGYNPSDPTSTPQTNSFGPSTSFRPNPLQPSQGDGYGVQDNQGQGLPPLQEVLGRQGLGRQGQYDQWQMGPSTYNAPEQQMGQYDQWQMGPSTYDVPGQQMGQYDQRQTGPRAYDVPGQQMGQYDQWQMGPSTYNAPEQQMRQQDVYGQPGAQEQQMGQYDQRQTGPRAYDVPGQMHETPRATAHVERDARMRERREEPERRRRSEAPELRTGREAQRQRDAQRREERAAQRREERAARENETREERAARERLERGLWLSRRWNTWNSPEAVAARQQAGWNSPEAVAARQQAGWELESQADREFREWYESSS